MKKILLFITLASFLISVNPTYACVKMAEAVILNDTLCNQGNGKYTNVPLGSNIVTVYSVGNWGNKTEIIKSLEPYKNYSYLCETLNNETGNELRCAGWQKGCHWMYYKYLRLTDNDIEIISDFLSKGYSVLKQTPNEYQKFLENANKVNNDLSTCDYYLAVAYRNDWTGYVFNDESEKTEACAQAPRKLCGSSGLINILWNDLSSRPITTNIFIYMLSYWWIFLIVVVAIIIGIIYKLKRKS